MHFIQPQHPRAFLTIYSDVILPISSSTHANNLKAPLDGLPDRILMRYETDRELLYISKQFFTEHHEPRLLKSMQRYQTFKGSRQLRIEKGTGIKSDPQTCYCFDLNAPHVLKEECYGTKEHKHRNLVRSVEVHDTDLRRLATQTFAELNAKGEVEVMVGVKLDFTAEIDCADIFGLEVGASAFAGAMAGAKGEFTIGPDEVSGEVFAEAFAGARGTGDRKSTRLNSSH